MGRDLTEGSILRTIISASWPTVLAFFLQSSLNIVDAIFVGWISAHALAAVSMSFPLIFMMISLGTGIGIGATSVVARHVGAKELNAASSAAKHAIVLAVVAGFIIMFAGLVTAPTLFRLMGVDEDLTITAVNYLNIILYFAPMMLITIVGNSIHRAEGDMKTPLIVMGSAAVINIFLDPIFIFSLGLGVEGAAYATVISGFMGLTYMWYHVASSKSWLDHDFRGFRFEPKYIKAILSIGFPASIANIIMSVGMFFFTAMVAGFGVEAIAAFGIGFRLDSLALLFGMGITIAIMSIVGQSLGARNRRRARQATVRGGLLASSVMSCFGVAYYVFAPQIVSVFNTDPKVMEYGVEILRILPLTYVVVGMSMCISGAFLGAGRAILSLSLQASRILVFSVPAAYFLSERMGLSGIWWGILLGSYMAFLTALALYRFTDWDKYTH